VFLTLLLVGTLQVTSYRSVPAQTDSTPFYTATGEHVHAQGIAVSRDLLCPDAYGLHRMHSRRTCRHKHKLHYGDWLYIEGYGLKVLNDVMAERHTHAVDMWVKDKAAERRIGTRHLKIYRVITPAQYNAGVIGYIERLKP
jgi:hypothetical protein